MHTRILVVSHYSDTRNAISQSLSLLGYSVTAVSGEHAMAAIHAGAPDIVLTEVVMPDKCGIELIREIKRAGSRIKIIATSAAGVLDRGYILELARKLGADLVLPKPFEIDQLLAALEQVLKRPTGGDRRDIV